MSRLARLPLSTVAVVCAAWVAFIVFLPRLVVAASMLGFRVRSLVEGTHGGAAFKAEWKTPQVMVVVACLPALLFLGAWGLSRSRRWLGQR